MTNKVIANGYAILLDGAIVKILNVVPTMIETTEHRFILLSKISKASDNIKDLLQEGDFVNGYPVLKSIYTGDLTVDGLPLSKVLIYDVMTKKYFDNHKFSLSLESDNNVEWKPLKELPKYEISTLGSVRSLKTGKTIAYVTDRKEPSVRLLVDEKTRSRKRFLVAKLLLETFIEPQPNEYSTVGFKDGNNQNIDLSNLFWVSNDVHKVAQKSEPKTGDGLSSDKKKTSPIVSKLKKSTSKLDDIDDSDFYKEMEAKSKQRFKDELLRRLNDVK